MPGIKTPEQNRCIYLSFRCYTGFDRRDKAKKNRITGKALTEWQELLEKRFIQSYSGGRPFVLEICQIVKTKKTPKGLDLTDRTDILECLAKWSNAKCEEHDIDPGTETMVALNATMQTMRQKEIHVDQRQQDQLKSGAPNKAVAKRARPEDKGQALEQKLSELEAKAVIDAGDAERIRQQVSCLTQKLADLEGEMARDGEQMQKIQEAIVKFKLERQTRRKAPRLEQQPSSVVFEGYSPYAHKKGVNDVLMHNFSETMRIYRPDDFEWEEVSAFCLDGPDVMTTRALNRLGVRVQVVNDNRHGDFPAIQQAVVDQKIQADVFQGTVCDFLAEAKDAAYSFILHDGHGWKGRAEEIDALLNRIAPVCLFAVSVQIKGCGVHCSHGPVQNVKVKKEQPASDDEEGDVGAVITTDVKEHTEIQQFTNMITDKMALRDIKIRRTYPAYDALGRDPRTMFRVLMWVLDAREYKNIKA